MVLPLVSDYVAQLSSVSRQQQVSEAGSIKAEVHNLLVFLLPGRHSCKIGTHDADRPAHEAIPGTDCVIEFMGLMCRSL